jgi:hypothetical protein
MYLTFSRPARKQNFDDWGCGLCVYFILKLDKRLKPIIIVLGPYLTSYQ